MPLGGHTALVQAWLWRMWRCTFHSSGRPHSSAQAVTLGTTYHDGVRELFNSLTFDCCIHPLQLLLIELIERQLDQANGAEQIAVALRPFLGDGCWVLYVDGLPFLHPIAYLRTVFLLIRTALPLVLQLGQRWEVFRFS